MRPDKDNLKKRIHRYGIGLEGHYLRKKGTDMG